MRDFSPYTSSSKLNVFLEIVIEREIKLGDLDGQVILQGLLNNDSETH